MRLTTNLLVELMDVWHADRPFVLFLVDAAEEEQSLRLAQRLAA